MSFINPCKGRCAEDDAAAAVPETFGDGQREALPPTSHDRNLICRRCAGPLNHRALRKFRAFHSWKRFHPYLRIFPDWVKKNVEALPPICFIEISRSWKRFHPCLGIFPDWVKKNVEALPPISSTELSFRAFREWKRFHFPYPFSPPGSRKRWKRFHKFAMNSATF
ncbi:hypothetical protein [Sinorhizobium meliloti]|uniref:hypothetical protein n=1 Tax=Rhizobium meliloti TaxID=382 RepID=UPI001F1B1897|nr:hypothetical protein [Sinorhizobium meliloti]WQO43467.1 hypothetical protein U8C34_33885 [Sinorhizobium meliloti]WQO83816.1 hypothetical protein U8C44_33870 [Sinorhizobium meliloti]